MNRFTDSVRNAVANENWHAALGLALALPDICGKLDAPKGTGSQMRFEAWFDTYLGATYTSTSGGKTTVFMSAADCYALRCCYLHAGESDISEQRAQETLEKFFFTTKGVHRIMVEKTLTVNVAAFCEDICGAVDTWWNGKKDDPDTKRALQQMLTIHNEPFSPHPLVQIG